MRPPLIASPQAHRAPGLTRRLAMWIAGLSCLAAAGCRQDMHNQPKFYPQRGSAFYSDGRSARPQVPGTVARSQLVNDDYFHTGLLDGKEGDGLPLPLNMDLLQRGQERYNIYCAPCHSRAGNGLGMIVQRGYHPAASFHSERLRQAPLGHFFHVMTNGLGAMPNYAAELAPQDRWAVAAYIRALQLSQHASESDIPAGHRTANLSDIAVQQGFPSQFLDPWTHPYKLTTPQPAPTPKSMPALQTESTPPPLPASPQALPPTENPALAPSTPTETAHDTAAGQQTYMRNCAGCHQISLAGRPPNIPSMIGIVSRTGPDQVRYVIQSGIPTGKPPMPPFPNLSTADVDNLIAFLQSSK